MASAGCPANHHRTGVMSQNLALHAMWATENSARDAPSISTEMNTACCNAASRIRGEGSTCGWRLRLRAVPFGVTAGPTVASCCCGSHDRPPSVERRSSMEWGKPSAHVTKRRSAKTSSVLFTSMIAGIR